MTRRTTPARSSNGTTPFSLAAVAVGASLLLVVLVFWISSPPASMLASISQSDVTIESGTAAGIPYYHCASATSSTSSSPLIELVLLHGAAFTKENWKSSGILQKFCMQDGVRVTALDLNIKDKHGELFTVLDALKESAIVRTLPVTGLVTPSASGTTILDAINTGNVETLRSDYAQMWIPVATNAALQYSADDLQVLQDWPILAIYGDRDSAGRRSSELLQHSATNAKVVQLQGSHPCYLDSPDDFVRTILQHVASQ